MLQCWADADIACLFVHKRSGLFGGQAFIQPIRTIQKAFENLCLSGKKPAFLKGHFDFGHGLLNRLISYFFYLNLQYLKSMLN